MRKIILPLLTVLLCGAPYAHSANFFLTLGAGEADTDFDSHYTGDNDGTARSYAYQVKGGYSFDSGVIIGLGYRGQTNDALFGLLDNYHLNELTTYLGYRIPVAKHFRITPIVGYSHWELTMDRHLSANSEETEFAKFRGNQFYPQLNLEFPINNLVSVYTSFSKINFDFGDSQVLTAGVIFDF